MSNNVIAIKKRFLGQLPTVFNPSDFVSRDIEAENIIADNIVSSNIKNLEQVVSTSIALNSDGLPSDVATKTYVNSSISTLQNTLLGTNIPSQLNQNLDTILEIDNFITDLQNTVNTKANQTDLNTTNNNVLTNTNNITSNTNNITTLQTSKANQTDLNSTNTRVSTLESKTNVISYNPTTNTTTINSKLQVNLDQGNTGSTYLGDDSSDSFVVRATSNFIGPVVGLTKSTVGLSNIDNTSDINKPLSTAQKTYIDNGLSLKANQTDLNTTNTNVLNNTNSITTLQSSKQDTLSYDTVPTQNSTKLLTSSSLYNTFSNYVTSSGLGSTLASYVLSSSLTTTLSSYLTISSASSTYQTIAGMSSYLTTSLASSTYQTISGMSNYASLSGNNTLTGNNTLSGSNTINVSELYEQVNSVSSITTSLSLNYATCKGVNYIQTPTSNFSVALTNVPTSSTNASYSIVLMIPSKFYANSCTINGTSRTIYFTGGSANVTVNSSAVYVLQQISVMYLNSSTPIVTSSVISMF